MRGASCNAPVCTHMCARRLASGARVQLQADWISAIKHPDVGFGLHPLNSTKGFFHSLIFILKTSVQLVENSKARPICTSPGNAQRKQRAEWGLRLPTHPHSPGHREAWSGISDMTQPGVPPDPSWLCVSNLPLLPARFL